MNIESITTGQGSFSRTSSLSPGSEQLTRNRATAKTDPAAGASSTEKEKANQPQAEELLQSIKALTDNGSYSVQFEMNKDTNDLVIRLIDPDSGDVIRQIPAEEILGSRKTLADLRGNLLQAES